MRVMPSCGRRLGFAHTKMPKNEGNNGIGGEIVSLIGSNVDREIVHYCYESRLS
jgi:hypothetical protein